MMRYGNYYAQQGSHFLAGEILHFIIWAVLLSVLIGFIVHVVNTNLVRGGSNESNSEDALSILKKRYAKGEITKKEFEEIKKDIQ